MEHTKPALLPPPSVVRRLTDPERLFTPAASADRSRGRSLPCRHVLTICSVLYGVRGVAASAGSGGVRASHAPWRRQPGGRGVSDATRLTDRPADRKKKVARKVCAQLALSISLISDGLRRPSFGRRPKVTARPVRRGPYSLIVFGTGGSPVPLFARNARSYGGGRSVAQSAGDDAAHDVEISDRQGSHRSVAQHDLSPHLPRHVSRPLCPSGAVPWAGSRPRCRPGSPRGSRNAG